MVVMWYRFFVSHPVSASKISMRWATYRPSIVASQPRPASAGGSVDMACPPGGAIVCAGGAPYFVDIATGFDIGARARSGARCCVQHRALSSTRLI
jgi:hypothetical protein